MISKKLSAIKKIVGSLLIVGFEGQDLTASCRNFLEQWDLGGVILLKRNIDSLEQVSGLNSRIYATAKVPPIVSVDHEGGQVFRLPEPFTHFPAMAQVGRACVANKDFKLARRVGMAMGRELAAVGFNVDWAPVLDVNSNPDNPVIGPRAFSSDPEDAAHAALQFLEGLQEIGVLGCGKHFPGHGDTFEDSHVTLPVVDKEEAALRLMELVPFKEAIADQISMIMTAHVRYPHLDPDWPATLSGKILTGLLRQQMAYEGLIVSDDLFMKGIAEHWGQEEAAERFLRAGGDIVMLCHKDSVQRRVAAHLVHTVEKDAEFRALLEQKLARIQALRPRLRRGVHPELFAKYQEEHQLLAESLG
jgi:beta-N-acetylhexosaminidase